MRTTRNACIDRLRRRRLTRLLFPSPSEPEQFAETTADPATGPDGRLEQRRLGGRLLEAVRELREPHRSVVILREIQGLTYQQIAESLELPINSVKVYLHRGRKALRERLGEEHAAQSAC
jgi:RNA polymerase sigma-70 factor (ECF subfamily)